eukprot:TRINITY_DN52316_c0_g1_i1.p1 TRINITY_DN52316_c0_g1~~TRINITY_DN52316_c0_g1_i1.p1  ORF type:complete len:366 (+),score=104.27 TRINITY_DN52316_c0_g1_i1:48-1145(+)
MGNGASAASAVQGASDEELRKAVASLGAEERKRLAEALVSSSSGKAAMKNVKVGALEMPLCGFGTYKVGAVPASASSAAAGAPPPPAGPEVCEKILSDALDAGYTMFDCAQFYMNEKWVGDAFKKKGVDREKLFIISKVWNDIIYQGADAVIAQVDKALSDLQCGYIDLFLVHWPVPGGKHVEAYNALRKCKADGKIKEIGLSNYTIEDYEELRAAGAFGEGGKDKPAMNQIEINPLLFRKKTLDFFAKEGVHMQAYRGLMQANKSWEHETIKEIVAEAGKTPAQVLGRFLVQQNISHVPKASSPARMTENMSLFDFELSEAQMAKLSSMTPPDALDNFKALYTKCIWRDTPEAGAALPGDRTLD